jgi:hypothetical protein
MVNDEVGKAEKEIIVVRSKAQSRRVLEETQRNC